MFFFTLLLLFRRGMCKDYVCGEDSNCDVSAEFIRLFWLSGLSCMSFAVVTEDLTKCFEDVTAVDRLNLRVEMGEVFGFLGPNGSGKTTAVRILCGIMDPTSGSALTAGYDVVEEPDSVKAVIGYMPQRFALYEDLTVRENLEFYGGIYRIPKEELEKRIGELLELVQLDEVSGRLSGELSGGMKQRLSLACAMVHSPRVLFLDEPTAGVDPPLRRVFWRYFRKLNAEGTTLFINTHYMDEAELCDRVGILNRGRLIAVGSPDALRKKTSVGKCIRITPVNVDEAISALERTPYASSIRVDQGKITVRVEDRGVNSTDLLSLLSKMSVKVRDIETVRPSLEDVFIELVDKSEAS